MTQAYAELLGYLYAQIERKRDTINAYSRQGMDTAYVSGEYDAFHDVVAWIRDVTRKNVQDSLISMLERQDNAGND